MHANGQSYQLIEFNPIYGENTFYMQFYARCWLETCGFVALLGALVFNYINFPFSTRFDI